MLTVSYFSAGASSAVATKLVIDQIDRIMYTHIGDHHEDSLRFVRDCEAWFGKPVEVWQSPYKDVDTACRANSFIRSPQSGAVCTRVLKRTVRKQFEYENEGSMRIVWGLDCDETERIDNIRRNMPNHEHLFPLADQGISKEHAHQILKASGIKRPAMYDLGYNNNNCRGCVKGGMGYWNHVRVDFPDIFVSRVKLERDLGFPILSNKYGYLDELDPQRGRHTPPVVEDCGIMCELMAI
jgi:3'-phosphoadenosine 5'-phosphosulfate sulfotransferase (PAPS reductase)/FAD synthetase